MGRTQWQTAEKLNIITYRTNLGDMILLFSLITKMGHSIPDVSLRRQHNEQKKREHCKTISFFQIKLGSSKSR